MKEDIDYLVRNNVMEVLIECRKNKGITQADLAEQLGLKPTTVASWEQGKSLPNIQTLYRLAQYYHKTIGYMYGEGKKDG